MTVLIVLTSLGAVALLVLGLQVLSRQLQRFPLDHRNPGPLVETSRRRAFVHRPADLDRLHAVVAEARSSPAVAAAKLEPILAELEATAPGDRRPASATDGTRRPRRRADPLAGRLAELERRWGVDDG